jgi:probable O-glycosylation ligase (exosortase A-associated)
MRDIFVLVLLILLAPIAFFRPFFGVLAWTWVSYMTPVGYAWGWGRYVPQGTILAIPTIAGLFFTSKRRNVPKVRETILLAVLWIWFAITTIHVWQSSIFVHHLSDTLSSFFAVSKTIFMIFIATVLVTNRKRLHWWYLVTCGSIGLFAIKGAIFGLRTGGDFRIYGPPNSMISDNNDFALAVNMCLPMFLYMAQDEPSRWIRLALRTTFLFGVGAVILSYSRGGLLGLLAVGAILLFQARHKLRTIAAVGALALVIFSIAPGQWMTRMETIPTAAHTDPSAEGRITAWRLATLLALDHPILGGGFETYTPEMYKHYGIQGNIKDLGWTKEAIGPHSIYFETLAEQGFVGLFFYLILLLSCLLTSWRVRRWTRRHKSLRPWRPYCDMVIASTLAYATSGAFLGRAYFPLFYQLVATTIILFSLAQRELRELREKELAIELSSGSEGLAAADEPFNLTNSDQNVAIP